MLGMGRLESSLQSGGVLGNSTRHFLNTIESLAASSPNAVKFKIKRLWELHNKITILLWFQAIYNTSSVLCLSSHRTTGINYANDMRPFLSDNIRRKTTGNWKIFLLHNMSSAITGAGKGREGVFPGSYTLDSQPSTSLHFVPQFFLHKKS
jgi:hypothetical protein